jgi:hypothetical protein
MVNAKQEFIEATEGTKVIAAQIQFGYYYKNEEEEKAATSLLKKGYTQEEYDAFLDSIDMEYDDGYGGQELFGTIWCEGGIWFTRGEYDGSEWWSKHEYPAIPDILEEQNGDDSHQE